MSADFQLTKDQIEEYGSAGAICLRKVFSNQWVEKVKQGIERNMASPSPFSEFLKVHDDPNEGAYFNDYCNWKNVPEFRDFAFNSPAARIAGALMQSQTAVFYHEHVLNKQPGTLKPTPWHHDQSYYPIDGFKVCSIWMPVDPVPMETTLCFIKGSHRWGRWFYPRKLRTSKNYSLITNADNDCEQENSRTYENVPEDEINSGKYEIIRWALEPGDCVVFHMRTLHGAPGNLSSKHQRRILSTRWLGDDAALARRPWEVSPSTHGGLNYGERAVSEEFPLVWKMH